MIHGMQNDNSGALNKFMLAQQALDRVGYRHPVVGYSYDSNVRNAHIRSLALRALIVGQKIAKKNGRNLSRFILDLKDNTDTSVRLMGHSLGTQVIMHCMENLASATAKRNIIKSVHFFGSSIEARYITSAHRRTMCRIVSSAIVNYYSPADDVLRLAHEYGHLKNPIGYSGYGVKFPKYRQRKVHPKNHRFASYADTIKSFP